MTSAKGVLLAACTTALLLLVAGPASAHVSVEADNVRPGALSTLTVHVPNESQSADTVRLDLQLPDGFSFVDATPLKDWKAVAADDVVTIRGATIPPGEEVDLRIRIRNTTRKGEYAFPVVQTYSDGERARWIGEDGSDNPAPLLTIEGRPVTQPTPHSEAPAQETDRPQAIETVSPDPVPTDEPVGDNQPPDTGGVPAVVVAALIMAVVGVGALVFRSRGR